MENSGPSPDRVSYSAAVKAVGWQNALKVIERARIRLGSDCLQAVHAALALMTSDFDQSKETLTFANFILDWLSENNVAPSAQTMVCCP
jgi:hypothetical protein